LNKEEALEQIERADVFLALGDKLFFGTQGKNQR
jgi:hypothetical protein